MANSTTTEGVAKGPLARSPSDQAIHDLSNGMNALLMNAAVLAARIDEIPPSLQPFVRQLGAAGQRSREQLAVLAAIVGAIERESPKRS